MMSSSTLISLALLVSIPGALLLVHAIFRSFLPSSKSGTSLKTQVLWWIPVVVAVASSLVLGFAAHDQYTQERQTVQQIVDEIEADSNTRILEVDEIRYSEFVREENVIPIHFKYENVTYKGRIEVLDGQVQLLVPLNQAEGGFVPFDADWTGN